MKLITLAFATLLLSSAAAAETGSSSSSSSSAPQPSVASDGRDAGQSQSADRQERRVCRRLDTTGSRNARPTCMTVRQWRQYDRP